MLLAVKLLKLLNLELIQRIVEEKAESVVEPKAFLFVKGNKGY
jgi:hypothetical protein